MYKKLILASLALTAAQLHAASEVRQATLPTDAQVERYDLSLGDFLLDAKVRFTLGYDDNPSLSSTVAEDSFYQETAVTIDLFDNKAQFLNLSTNFEIGYKSFLKGDGNDGLIINTNGETFRAIWEITENTAISFHDILTVNHDEVDDSAANEDKTNLSILENTTAIQLYQNLTETISWGTRFGYTFAKSLNGDFEEREREDFSTSFAIDWQAGENLTLTPYVNYIDTDYDKNINTDGDILTIGIDSQYYITSRIRLNTSLGYQKVSSDILPGSTSDDNAEGVTGSFALQHTITDKLQHRLSISSETIISNDIGTSIEKQNIYTYNIGYAASESLVLEGSLSYIDADQKSASGEKYDLYLPSVRADYKISERLTTYCEVGYSDKTSDQSNSSYDRSRVDLGLIFDF